MRYAIFGLSFIVSAASAQGAVWQPAAGFPWQIVLDNSISVDSTVTPANITIFDIDLFANTGNGDNDPSKIAALHADGKRVICYFSAGSYEPDRPDSNQFTSSDMGNQLQGWEGEYWLNTKSTNVQTIMSNRIALAAKMGCDAIDPDNVDAYDNDNGLNLDQDDAVNFVNFLAAAASSHNLAIGLKNAGDIVTRVLGLVQFSVQEQCANQTNCALFKPFTAAGKPVFHIEYPDGFPSDVAPAVFSEYCDGAAGDASISDFSTVLKDLSLTGPVDYCNGFNSTTVEDD